MGIFHSYVSLPEGNRFRSHITLSGLWPNSVAICIIHLHCQEVGLLPSWHVAFKLRSRSPKFFHVLFGLETCGVDMEKNHEIIALWGTAAGFMMLMKWLWVTLRGAVRGKVSRMFCYSGLCGRTSPKPIWWDTIAPKVATFSSFLLHTFQAIKLDKFVDDLFPPQNHPQQDMNPNMVPSGKRWWKISYIN